MLRDIITKGSTDRSVVVTIIDSTAGTPETGVVFDTAGIALWYRREGAAVTAVTEATLAALTTAHTDGGFLHMSDGEYRLDLPDAAFATGANYVDYGGTVTGMVVIGGRVRLVDYSLEDAVRMGLTALPNAAADAAGGLPISDAGGLDLDAKVGALTFTVAGDLDVNVQSWKGSAAPDNTGDAFARLGAPAGASVSADVAAVKAETVLIVEDTGTTLPATLATAQADLDTLTGTDGATLATAQANYAPAKAGNQMDLVAAPNATAVTAIQNGLATPTNITAGTITTVTNLTNAPTSGDLTATMKTSVTTAATAATPTVTLANGAHGGAAASITLSDYANFQGSAGAAADLLVSTTIATLASQTSFTLTAGSADNDAYNGQVAIVTDSATSTQKAVAAVSDYVGATKTVTLAADPAVFTMAAGDTVAIVAALGAAATGTLTQQDVRDAMALATAETPATGSMDKMIADVLEDTGTTLPTLFGAPTNADFSLDLQDIVTRLGLASILTGAHFISVEHWSANIGVTFSETIPADAAIYLQAYSPSEGTGSLITVGALTSAGWVTDPGWTGIGEGVLLYLSCNSSPIAELPAGVLTITVTNPRSGPNPRVITVSTPRVVVNNDTSSLVLNNGVTTGWGTGAYVPRSVPTDADVQAAAEAAIAAKLPAGSTEIAAAGTTAKTLDEVATTAKQIASITHNADGTINVVTFTDASTETYTYTGGLWTGVTYG